MSSHPTLLDVFSAQDQLKLLGILYVIYYGAVCFLMIDGGFQELMGHSKGGHAHSRLHRVLWQWHTGLHVHPHRSYGDEGHRRRSANPTNRATPEGSIVYWSKMNRQGRAVRNNAISLGSITFVYGLLFDTHLTVQVFTVALTVALFVGGVLLVLAARKRVAAAPVRKIVTRPLARVTAAAGGTPGPETAYVAGGTVVEEKPQMDGGVPQQVLGMLLADTLGCSAAETVSRLTLTPERGTLTLPDHFTALDRQRSVVEEIVQAQNSARLGFTWATSAIPRTASWVPIVTTLPREAPFRSYLDQLQRLPGGTFGVGLNLARSVYVSSHNGDSPWHLRSAGSGSGKSTGFQVKLAQICHNDPLADVYCWDSKQVSFIDMHGIPGVHIYDDPVAGMPAMWQGFYDLKDIVTDRYTALRKRQATLADFNDIWVLVDEGNDLATQFKTYYQRFIKGSGDPAQPTVWAEAVVSLIYLGRQVKVRGEWMFQNMTDRVLGGVSLRDAFNPVGMAAYKKNQWARIIGTTPAEECKYGPGKICMVNGPDQQWVQGFYDDPGFLREYALAGRKDRR